MTDSFSRELARKYYIIPFVHAYRGGEILGLNNDAEFVIKVAINITFKVLFPWMVNT